MIRTVDPSTEEIVEEHAEHARDEVRERVEASERAFQTWSDRGVDHRAASLRRVAGLLRAKKSDLSRVVTREMGKPITQAMAEVDKCADAIDHLCGVAPVVLAAEGVATEASRSVVRFDPLGPVLAIMPWNFPLWQVVRCAAPALLAGNTVLLKHAPNVTGTALALDGLFAEASLGVGVFQSLVLSNEAVGEVITHPSIAALAFTGSTSTGARVASTAASAFKKTVLELGGSDAFIVLGDADVDLAAEQGALSRLQCSGQSCIAAKRFLVERSVAPRFTAALVDRMRAAVQGSPSDPGTTLGPLARDDLRTALRRQVQVSRDAGARCLLGGVVPSGVGFFYPPTVLTDVAPGMPCFDEETFGPVAAIRTVSDLDEAVSLANLGRYGLGASLWTSNLDRARAVEGRLAVGSLFVNAIVRSDARLPFGGVKHSGHGRELGAFGLRELVNIKTVWVA